MYFEIRGEPSKPWGCRSRRCRRRTWRWCGAMLGCVCRRGTFRPPFRSMTQTLNGMETDLPDGHVARGHEAIMDHIRRWADQWDDWTVEVERIVDAGSEQVVALSLRERGRSKSGLDMDERHAESVHLSRRQGHSSAGVLRPDAGPRSRGAVGVGDVAGERGDRARSPSTTCRSAGDLGAFGWRGSTSTRRSNGIAPTAMPDLRPASIEASRGRSVLGDEWLAAWETSDFEYEDLLDAGDRVVAARLDQRMRGRATGIEVTRASSHDSARFTDGPDRPTGSSTPASRKPSKPPGCRSRRCRRRTWRSCGDRVEAFGGD